MKNYARRLVVSAALAACSLSASANVVIDFNELEHDANPRYEAPISSKGFIISNSFRNLGDPLGGLGTYTRSDSRSMDPGHASIFVTIGGTTTTLERADHNLFSMVSIDLADFYNDGLSNAIEFSFVTAADTHVEQFVLDTAKGAQRYFINRSDLMSVSWKTLNTSADVGHQFDNIVIGEGANPGNNVPEPASLGLLGVGLFGICATRRSRTSIRRQA